MSEVFKSFFKKVGGNEGTLCHYNTRLDTYGCGCQHDCQYCYAKSLLEFRKLWNKDAPKAADLDAIRRRIKSSLKPGDIVRLGGMVDCFQPTEREKKVTRATIGMLNQENVGYLIVTKSHLIAHPDYLPLLRDDLAHAQISVTCTDDDRALSYERCSKTSKRLEAFKTLQDAGVDVALRLSPYIVHGDNETMIDLDAIAELKPKKVLVEFLRVNHWIEKWLRGIGIEDLHLYSLKHGGYRHLPLDVKLKHLESIESVLPGAELSVCEDVPEHWQYFKDNFNHNPDDCCNLRIEK